MLQKCNFSVGCSVTVFGNGLTLGPSDVLLELSRRLENMRKRYRFDEKEAAYFVSFAVVYWIDVFIRESYFSIVIDSLDFCRKKKGMQIYAYVIMPSHLHIVFRSSSGDPGGLMRDFKGFTSKKLLKTSSQFSESRGWMSRMFEEAGTKKSYVQFKQFWQQDNYAIQLWSEEMFSQKVNYIHKPVSSPTPKTGNTVVPGTTLKTINQS